MEIRCLDAPPPSTERGLASSPSTYAAVAVVIAAASQLAFAIIVSTAALFSAWFFLSGAVILLNRITDGSRWEKPIHHLHAFVSEMNAWGFKIIQFPHTFFSRTHRPTGNLKGTPILMLNGYLSFGSTWGYQKRRLTEAGLGPIYTMNIGSGRSIDTYTRYVEAKVKEIQQETGRKDLILIGHSKGGLVASHFATSFAPQIGSNVTDLITIGSPLAGTPIARIGFGLDAAEMRPASPFHRNLRNRIGLNAQTRFFHIASTVDRVVPLSSALFGNQRDRQMILKDTGHVALLFSSRVAHQIVRWLKPVV